MGSKPFKTKNPAGNFQHKIMEIKKKLVMPKSTLQIANRIDAEKRVEGQCDIETDLVTGKSRAIKCDIKIIEDVVPQVQYTKNPDIKIQTSDSSD